MFCSHCGAQITEETKFCPHCGAGNQATQQVAQTPQPVVVNVVNTNANTNSNTNINAADAGFAPRKSRWVAFFLCFLLGYLGAHKFYVGKVGMGILYLLTFGLGGIGWAIDTIVLLFGGSRDKWGRSLV